MKKLAEFDSIDVSIAVLQLTIIFIAKLESIYFKDHEN